MWAALRAVVVAEGSEVADSNPGAPAGMTHGCSDDSLFDAIDFIIVSNSNIVKKKNFLFGHRESTMSSDSGVEV